jgi:transcriptional regulator with XRE-family HTH domain
VKSAIIIREARRRSALSLRGLARRAGTSHATLRAYEAGNIEPTVPTLQRIVQAAGFDLDVALTPRVDGDSGGDRGEELEAALELAALFPADHPADPDFPRFVGQ